MDAVNDVSSKPLAVSVHSDVIEKDIHTYDKACEYLDEIKRNYDEDKDQPSKNYKNSEEEVIDLEVFEKILRICITNQMK